MPNSKNALPAPSAYDKSLAIVVPYRDRAEHLEFFISHVLAYFERDKLDRQIPVSIHIVEQNGSAPFNRGKIKNCGYMLARDTADYVCFHDVDYLPIWADYSWSAKPARLAWHGLRLLENWETFFGAVVLFDKAAFERVNGYSNGYWGWGPEDKELGMRCVAAGLAFDRRDGTYRALPHTHSGFSAPGVFTEEAKRNLAVYEKRRDRIGELMDDDGLRNLKFETIRRLPIKMNEVELPNAFHYLVDIGVPE
ncbi:MAG: galactosyltransferase-related protein [Pseudolabrys sp.]